MKYDIYSFNQKEKVFLSIVWIGISGVLAYFFYRSWIIWGVIVLFFPFFVKWQRKVAVKRRKWELTLAFREAVVMVAANLQAGNSVENAFRRTYGDLKNLLGEEADMTKEFLLIGRGLDNNLILEKLLLDLGVRSGVEDIMDFADIFAVAKRSGGNLREIITDTAEVISEKIEMKRSLRILISEKQFEQKIMSVIPFFILIYIGFTSPGYFDSLYHTLSGMGIMTACLTGYILALIWGMKITAIEV
ncbi:MAG: type II secretion system F family protein [Lachnospiraceae bacterium]|nr:type II secretion system F family protein [Lachnospiraceae bacterium]